MKKIFIIFFCLILITACNNKKEYHLIELTSEELANNIMAKETKNFVFAVYNSSEDNAENFMKDLKNVVKNANINIYYIDYQHIDTESSLILFNSYQANFTTNGYHVLQNKDLVISKSYTDFKTMYKDLKSKAFKDSLATTSNSKKEKYLKEAKKLYDEGNISLSYNVLNKAWNLKEAKEFYNNSKYYKVLNTWESILTNLDNGKVKYRSLLFYYNLKYFYEITKNYPNSEYEKPSSLKEYSQTYYYIKDDIISTSTIEKGTYKKKYKIIEVNEEILEIQDLKTKEKILYKRRVN